MEPDVNFKERRKAMYAMLAALFAGAAVYCVVKAFSGK